MKAEENPAKELLDCLPKDRRDDPTGERLAELLAEVSRKRIPVGSFSRMWILGSLHAKVAFGYFAYRLRRRFADAGEKERIRKEAHLSAALQLLGTMGYLRGAVMKVGQMLANLPEVVPDEFAEVLAALHFEAPPMHYALVREVFLDEFGREPEEVFASFDRHAFAAASLGQVHRATLHGGKEVAVKIQYPDIARTIRADLRNLRILLQPLCMTDDWSNLLEKLADLEQMLLMETDYEQEARFGRAVRELFAPEDKVVIPRVWGEYSTRRVLTTDFVPGVHLEEFLATDPSQELRDHFTHLMTASTMRIMYRLHWIFADPHPGNFIFMDDGRLGLIDFGCTRAMTDEEWRLQCEFIQAMIDEDEATMDRIIARGCLYDDPSDMEPDRLETMGKMVRWHLEPWRKPGLFDFGDQDFFRRGIDAFLEVNRKRYTRGVPLHLWSTRFILGARAVTYRLKGRCWFNDIYKAESDGLTP